MLFLGRFLLAGVLLLAVGACQKPERELVIYSARKEHLIADVFSAFERQTGIAVKYFSGSSAPLLSRLRGEGEDTPADVFISVDAGNLEQANREGLLLPIHSPTLNQNIPANYRSANGSWYGFSLRARTLVYHTDRVAPSELKDYIDLAGANWKGRLCLRSGKKIYTISLVSALIAQWGKEKTLEVLKGWVDNLALLPFDSDTQAMEAVLAGRCDVTVVNSYYYARLVKKYRQQGKSMPLAVYWPKPEHGGVHVNVSGAGIARHSKNPQTARLFLEWLSQKQAQHLFAESNLEYPVNPGTKWSQFLLAQGRFFINEISVADYRRYQPEAVHLINQANYR